MEAQNEEIRIKDIRHTGDKHHSHHIYGGKRKNSHIASIAEKPIDPGVANANAEHLVKCWNSFPYMEKVCQLVLKEHESKSHPDEYTWDELQAYRAAIQAILASRGHLGKTLAQSDAIINQQSN